MERTFPGNCFAELVWSKAIGRQPTPKQLATLADEELNVRDLQLDKRHMEDLVVALYKSGRCRQYEFDY